MVVGGYSSQMSIRISAALWGMVFRPVWSKIVNTFCLTSLKKGYVSVRFLAEEGEGRNVAIKKN